MNDGLASFEIRAGTVSGTNLLGTNISGAAADLAVLAAGASEIGNAELGTGAASGTKISTEYAPIKTGSPVAPGNAVLFGTGATSAGSIAWVVFGSAFAAAPTFLVTSRKAAPDAYITGSPVTVGSALVVAAGGAVDFAWMAAGSGRL